MSAKVSSLRTARAEAVIKMSPQSIELIRTGKAPKGDPLGVARVAAIQAAKNTPILIPYCHSVPLDYVGVDFELGDDSILVTIDVKAIYKTGVEMEALTAAAAAVLNLYDLLKPVDEEMEILRVTLLEKTGGKSDAGAASDFSAAVIVVSDRVSRGVADDVSGQHLRELLRAQGATVGAIRVVPDEAEAILGAVREAVSAESDLVFTTGGTGLGPRDITPESVIPILDSRLPGIEDQLFAYSRERKATAMLGRPFAGRIGKTIVIGLPGSPGAVTDAVGALFPSITHAFHIIDGGDHGG